MNVTVRFFGFTSELTGCPECVVTLNGTCTVQKVWDHVLRQYPRLSSSGRVIRFARNVDYVTPDASLQAGDVVSIIPPVAGG